MLGPDSSTQLCPQCQAQVHSEVKTKAGLVPILSGAFLCMIGYSQIIHHLQPTKTMKNKIIFYIIFSIFL